MIAAADADEVAADEPFWALYDSAFPADEREPREVILGAARAGVGRILRAREKGVTIGLASAHRLVDPPAMFLVYLAVAPAHRGRGIGRALVDAIAGAGPLVWEVDTPARASDENERARREKRIAFFRKLGGELVARPYAQPPLEPGAPPVPMTLMARPLPTDIERVVRAIYFEKYGAQNRIADETLRAILDPFVALWRAAWHGFVAAPEPWTFLVDWARETGCLPVHCDFTHALGITERGEVLSVEHDPPSSRAGERAHVSDLRLVNVAFHQGAKRHPWLLSRAPQRPAGAPGCPTCSGTGQLPRDLVCHCGGAGWLPTPH